MGNNQTYQYAKFLEGTEELGHSPELINLKLQADEELTQYYDEERKLDTLFKGFLNSVEKFPDYPFLGTRDESEEERPYKWKTYQEVYQIALNLAKGYQVLNLTPEINAEGKKWRFMGIQSKNREEWVWIDLANMFNSVITVPLYDTHGPKNVQMICNQTELVTLSCSGANYINSFIKLKSEGKLESLRNLISFEKFEQSLKNQAKEQGLTLYHIDEVINAGKQQKKEIQFQQPQMNSIYMFCYTSGTTGDPKAAMLSHGNLIAAAKGAKDEDLIFTEDDIHISYLPLAHSFEKIVFTICLLVGGKYGFYSGDTLKLLDDMKTLKPTLFITVPRLFNRIYESIHARLAQQTRFKQWFFSRAIASKQYYLENQGAYTHKFYDYYAFKNIKELTGGRIRVMITGSAPIRGEVLTFLRCIFACPIREGYGQTETSAPATVAASQDPSIGHVGGPLTCVKIRLRDIPEMGYTYKDQEGPRGELMLKGNSIFQGYFKDSQKTKDAFDNKGWLKTGDVALILQNGAIKIIDRATNIFKLSQGEYIAPEKLENIYCQSRFIAQIYVYGDPFRSFIVAIIVVDVNEVKSWANQNQLENVDMIEILQTQKLRQEIKNDLSKLAEENNLNGLEKIKNFYLTEQQFSLENDILTVTMKIRRNIAKKYYQNEIEELYTKVDQ